MISKYDELYEERRNAVDSWQGYQYQGKYALSKYLECLVEKFNYILHPRSIDFFEDLPESETEENPTFFSGRDVEFMHYGKKVKK